MKKTIKILCFILVTATVLSLFIGCQSGKNTDTSSTTFGTTATESTTEKGPPITITQFAYDGGVIPASEGTLQDNWFTREVAKIVLDKYNIVIKYVFAARAQAEQVLNTNLASGTAPDICISGSPDVIANYSRNGGLTDLGPLLDKYGDNIKAMQPKEWLDGAKIDGKQTRISFQNSMGGFATWIRKDWLDKVGMKEPTNPQELYEVLKAFKEQDPGKLGSKMVPFALPGDLMFIPEALLSGFMKEVPSKEKLATPYQAWPETKDCYRYLNKLYNEGLMGEFILDKDGSQWKKKLLNGELGSTVHYDILMGYAPYGGFEDTLRKTIPDAHLALTHPWQGPAFTNEIVPTMIVGAQGDFPSFFIPASSKNPVEAFKYLDFMASQEYLFLSCFGKKDVDYKIVDGIATPIDIEAFKNHVGWIRGQYQSLAFSPYINDPMIMKKIMTNSMVGEEAKAEYLKNGVIGLKVCTKYAAPTITYDKPVLSKYYADLNTKWNAARDKTILGSVADFDKNYDEALQKFKSEGGDLVVEEAVTLYRKVYGK